MKKTATILNAASLSGAIDFGTIGRLRAVLMPAAWTAAAISFQVSDDGVTYSDLFDDVGNPVKLTAPLINQIVALRWDFRVCISRFQFIKVQSGLPGALVAQGADRIITAYAEDPRL